MIRVTLALICPVSKESQRRALLVYKTMRKYHLHLYLHCNFRLFGDYFELTIFVITISLRDLVLTVDTMWRQEQFMCVLRKVGFYARAHTLNLLGTRTRHMDQMGKESREMRKLLSNFSLKTLSTPFSSKDFFFFFW